jgi:hypothetical protein
MNARYRLQIVVVEQLILLLRIREFPGSDLGQETGCPD